MATTSAPPRRPPTKPGPGEPRHLILPDGITSTGWPACRDTSAQIGLHYDPWQQELNRAILSKRADGFYAADTVVLSVPRQAGKTWDVGGVVFADSIIHPGTTTVWTAHRFKVSRESFDEMRAWARRPELTPHIDYDAITTAAGNECIPFRNGSRILFAARERGAIRGFTKVRRLVLDEAQILTESAMSDLAPTQNQAWNPQIILMGTPPKPTDPGEVFSRLREMALAGELDGVLYAEFSAEADCDIEAMDSVAQANPSFPDRTTERQIRRLRKLLTNDDDWRREGLGIWDDRLQVERIIPPDDWAACIDPDDRPDRITYAIAVGPDGKAATIAASDGRVVAVLEWNKGSRWLPAKLAEIIADRPGDVWLDEKSPAGALLPDLEEAGIAWHPITGTGMAQACGGIFTAITEDHTLRHSGQATLDIAVAHATRKNYSGAWVWDARKASVDISPLDAVTIARGAALQVDANAGGGWMVSIP